MAWLYDYWRFDFNDESFLRLWPDGSITASVTFHETPIAFTSKKPPGFNSDREPSEAEIREAKELIRQALIG